MFDSLKFWKKKESVPADIAPPAMPDLDANPQGMGAEPDLGATPPGLDQGPGEFPKPSAGLAPEQPAAFQERASPLEMPTPPGMSTPEPSAANKDFQLVNAKLDAIKAGIDHINARLDKIEIKEEKEIVAWR